MREDETFNSNEQMKAREEERRAMMEEVAAGWSDDFRSALADHPALMRACCQIESMAGGETRIGISDDRLVMIALRLCRAAFVPAASLNVVDDTIGGIPTKDAWLLGVDGPDGFGSFADMTGEGMEPEPFVLDEDGVARALVMQHLAFTTIRADEAFRGMGVALDSLLGMVEPERDEEE